MAITITDVYGKVIDEFTQWDSNITIYIHGLDLSKPPAIHFSNQSSNKSYSTGSTLEDDIIVTTVPNILLEQTETISIYVYTYNIDTKEGRTVEIAKKPVRPKKKPDDYIYEENITVVNVVALNNQVRDLSKIVPTGGVLNDNIIQFTSDFNGTELNVFSVDLSGLLENIDWKETVGTFDDIATTYPNPVDGWTVNVKDTDYTYRYNGSSWIAISANAIPKATNNVDGLLSKEDHTNYDDANSKKHVHDNKSVIDGITDTLVNNWNAAYTHSQSNHAPVNAEENQNAFSSIVVGSTTISADSKSDSLELSGNNVTITPDSANDKVTIEITKDNVISALGYTPGSSVDSNTTYTLSKSGSTITLTGNDGSTTSVEDTDTVYIHPTDDGNKHVPANGTENDGKFLRSTDISGNYEWSNLTKSDVVDALGYTPGSSDDTNTTYTLTKTGSTIILTGSDGSVTSVNDENIIYSEFVKSGSEAKSGLVPTPPTTAGNTKYLREDGTWSTPPNTDYTVATSSTLGLIKSGTDITVDSLGNVSVNDNSHNHVISNVDGLQTALDEKAANNHTHSEYVNQNAFSNITVGDTTVLADSTTDTLTLVAGDNVTLTLDTTNDKITIESKDTIYTHPTTSGNKHIPSGGASGQVLRWSADGTAVWDEINDTIYGVATSSTLGLIKSGTDITVDESGNVSINDDSHNHIIENVDGLQDALDSKATSSHVHNYAGSSSAGGSANSAIKLDSSAGSEIQPIYFSDGKPVATIYTLEKSVPSDAIFTDTNTWRGIQDNLTSTSTSDSLSANQGKVLKDLVDTKATGAGLTFTVVDGILNVTYN